MQIFNVYYQSTGTLRKVGTVEAIDGPHAIQKAREKHHIQWPVVHELDHRGDEKRY